MILFVLISGNNFWPCSGDVRATHVLPLSVEAESPIAISMAVGLPNSTKKTIQ